MFVPFFLVKIASIYVDELIQKYQETNSLESYVTSFGCYDAAIEFSSISQRFLICFTTESVQTRTKTKSSRYRSRWDVRAISFWPSGEI